MTAKITRKPRKMGRPSKYSKALAGRICVRLAQGQSMRKVCRDPKMPSMETLFRWLRIHPNFREQYDIAKQECADAMADEMVDIADDEAVSELVIDGVPVLDPETGEPYKIATSVGVQHAKLRVDTRKWIASKLKPKKYGDKITNEHQALDKDGERTKWEVSFVNADMINNDK